MEKNDIEAADGRDLVRESVKGSELGFVSTFYDACIQALQAIWDCLPSLINGTSKRQLRESIVRLILWGSGWKKDQLDSCLAHSLELHGCVTELLSGLAKASIQAMHHLFAPSLTPTMVQRIQTLAVLRKQAQQYHAPDQKGDDSEISDDDISESECSDGDDDASAILRKPSFENIQFYTACLMDLLPSMEEVYRNIPAPSSRLGDNYKSTHGFQAEDEELTPSFITQDSDQRTTLSKPEGSMARIEDPESRHQHESSRRGISYNPSQWAEKRDIITQLYAREGRSLREVKEILRLQYDFKPTDRMYQRKIAQWALQKKEKGPEMRAILSLARQREAAGQQSIFRIRGRRIDIEEIHRYFRRKGEDPTTVDVGNVAIPSTITVEPLMSPQPTDLGSTMSEDVNEFTFNLPASLNDTAPSTPALTAATSTSHGSPMTEYDMEEEDAQFQLVAQHLDPVLEDMKQFKGRDAYWSLDA